MFPPLQAKLKRFEEIERQLQDPEVLSNTTLLVELQREYGGLQKVALSVRAFNQREQDIAAARQMVAEEKDPEAREYAESELEELLEEQEKHRQELEDVMLAGAGIARRTLIMEIRAGTGGDEAALFARDLYEMYTRYAEVKHWKVEVLNLEPSDLGGIREIAMSISGEGAFYRLQFESGGHRVQRVPETETQGRIHTSAATVAVLPEPTEVELIIKPDDLRIDTFRAGGPGGQKVNKIESAIRITHLPTGTVVQCQDEKSQHKNKAKALRVLRSRILEQMQEKAAEERAEQRRTLIGSGDRNARIRTYNFAQGRVTDHRVPDLTLYKLDQIMQGDLDELIDGLIEFDRNERLQGN